MLTGYYDEGLKVQFSEPYTFESWVKDWEFPSIYFPGAMDNEDYIYEISELVAWAWPQAQRDTAQSFTVAQKLHDIEETSRDWALEVMSRLLP